MNHNNNYKFSEKERELFRSIANHIRTNPEDYKEAGKWIDEYCSESAYWSRRKDELEKLKKSHGTLPEALYQRDVDRLEKEIAEKRTPAPIILFQEAQHYLLDNYKDQEFLSKEVSAKVIIITWLLTDPDAEKADLHITGFEAWKWEPLDDVFKCNRDFKAFLFAQNKDSWMRLVNIAWEKVSSIREESILKPKPPEIFQKPPSADKENKPWYKKIYVWIAGALAFLLLLTNLILNFKEIKEWFPSQEKKSVSTIKEGTQEFLKENANEPNTRERTPLYSRTKKRVYDICERIEEDKLNPWLFINIDKMHPVTMHNGKVISYKGVLYEGAPRLVFWSDDFIPPFIEDAIVQVFDETIEECHKNGLEPKPYIDEANSLLLGFILHIYSRMADIDQKLSSTADSKNIGRKQTSLEVGRMRECLKEHYDAALLLASKGKNTN